MPCSVTLLLSAATQMPGGFCGSSIILQRTGNDIKKLIIKFPCRGLVHRSRLLARDCTLFANCNGLIDAYMPPGVTFSQVIGARCEEGTSLGTLDFSGKRSYPGQTDESSSDFYRGGQLNRPHRYAFSRASLRTLFQSFIPPLLLHAS